MGDQISMDPNQPGQQPQPTDQNATGAFPPLSQDQPASPPNPAVPPAPVDTLGGDPMLAGGATPQPTPAAPPVDIPPVPTDFSQAAAPNPLQPPDQTPPMPAQPPVEGPLPSSGGPQLPGAEQATLAPTPQQDPNNPLAVSSMSGIDQSGGGSSGGGMGRKLMGVGLIVLAVIILIALIAIIF